MTNRPSYAAAFHATGGGRSDPERRMPASGHGESDGHDVRVTKRHGIWTVTAAGIFVGDYLDPDAASAAAAQTRNPGSEEGDLANPWQRSEEGATP